MKSLRKIIMSLTALFLLVTAFSGCNRQSAQNSKKIKVIATIFPEYDWVKNLVKDDDNIQLSLLVKNGVDLHSYQPSTKDIVDVSSCDLFIYVGGESDKWVKDALKNATNKNMKVINLLDVLSSSVRTEEFVEGMQKEEEEEEDEDEIEYDEHVWLSLKNARTICKKITETLCELDSSNSQLLETNFQNYDALLSELDNEYENEIKSSKADTVIFCDRFPFLYLIKDYNLKYYAAFIGCSAESEASFETMSFLTNKVNELQVPAVFTIETSDQKIAKTVVKNSNNSECKILKLDSLQNTSLEQSNSGKTYIETMRNNKNILLQGLN